MERETGFEPATSTLARLHSTTELFPLAPFFITTAIFLVKGKTAAYLGGVIFSALFFSVVCSSAVAVATAGPNRSL